MLALITYSVSISDGWIVLYRISAGFCSIIFTRAYQSLQIDNRQRARVFYVRS